MFFNISSVRSALGSRVEPVRLQGVGAGSAQITREGIVPQPPLVHPSSKAVFVFVFALLLLRGWPPTDIAAQNML